MLGLGFGLGLRLRVRAKPHSGKRLIFFCNYCFAVTLTNPDTGDTETSP